MDQLQFVIELIAFNYEFSGYCDNANETFVFV